MKRLRNKRFLGFSLIEVLIAMVILSVGMIALARFQGSIIRNNSHSKQRTEAAVIAQNRIEEYRRFFSQGDAAQINNLIADTSENGGNTTFDVAVAETTLENGDIELHLTVTWPDIDVGDGTQPSENTTVELTSVVSVQTKNDSAITLVKLTSTSTAPTTTTTTGATTTTTAAPTTTTTTTTAAPTTTTTKATTTTTTTTTTKATTTTTTTKATTTTTTTKATTTTTTTKATTTTTTTKATTTTTASGGMMGGMMGM